MFLGMSIVRIRDLKVYNFFVGIILRSRFLSLLFRKGYRRGRILNRNEVFFRIG